MREIFDLKALGAESKTDVGIFFLAAGISGILDAVLNVAEFAQPMTVALLGGLTAFGVKKLVDGWREDTKSGRRPPPDRS